MLDTEPTDDSQTGTTADTSDHQTLDAQTPAPRRRRAASRPAGPPSAPAPDDAAPDGAAAAAGDGPAVAAEAPPAPAKKATRKRATRKAAAERPDTGEGAAAADEAPAKKTTRKRAARKTAAAREADAAQTASDAEPEAAPAAFGAPGVLFQPPAATAAPTRRRRGAASVEVEPAAGRDDGALAADGEAEDSPEDSDEGSADEIDGGTRRRRRGGRGRRGRGRGREDEADGGEAGLPESAVVDDAAAAETGESAKGGDDADDTEGGTRRRRRRRRRGGGEGEGDEPVVDDPPHTVTRVREPRKRARSDRGDREREKDDDDGVRSVKGSTRLEAKKQRRREGRDAGRRRPSVITEAEFLARRESVDRVMAVRQTAARTQIAVLEDGVLVEHYVSSASSSGLLGNVYLGKVQNVLPSMEAAFVDIGKGRNGVLYAGEVNWDAAGLDGQPRRIELALKSGDPVLVQVTKDSIGHKGARLTSQVSLAGRYLVLVPGGAMTGISRKLPENERTRLKAVLKKIVPEGAGVIVRTAAEGASEEELSRDVARLTAQWEDIERKSAKGSAAPTLLYGEPDMTIRVVRDVFNEDFASLVVSGDDAWDMLEPYVSHVAPDLRDRLTRWSAEDDVFSAHRVDEQLTKALDRKVWLPSGGYLVIDRTEAMIVVDVNTGKFVGQGGNLEETVTKNNLEAAEEIVRQLRLRDLGGIIVIDFIDMVLESNRDLVLRRLLECLGRDRTKHQVAEVTSLGLVQMTRKRVGQGLHEAFAETCETCNGRGYHIAAEPVERSSAGSGERRGDNGSGGGRAPRGSRESKVTREPKGPRPPKPAVPEPKPAVPSEPSVAVEPRADEVFPVAAEDPVEPAAATAHPVEPAAPTVQPVEPAAATVADLPTKRRRRKAVSPVTTL